MASAAFRCFNARAAIAQSPSLIVPERFFNFSYSSSADQDDSFSADMADF